MHFYSTNSIYIHTYIYIYIYIYIIPFAPHYIRSPYVYKNKYTNAFHTYIYNIMYILFRNYSIYLAHMPNIFDIHSIFLCIYSRYISFIVNPIIRFEPIVFNLMFTQLQETRLENS